MDVAELDIGIAHPPVTVLGLDNPDRFADQRLADKDQLARPFDLAVAAHAADRDIAAISRLRKAIGVAAWRGFIQRGWCFLSQRLVRPLVVVDRAKPVKALLLRRQAGGRGRRGLFPQRAMTRSCRPFCCGLPATIRSGRMPSLIHQIASRDKPPTPGEAKGGPLSERIANGKPCSLNAASKIGRTCSSSGRATA